MGAMKAWDVVGYAFKADIYCPGCIIDKLGVRTRFEDGDFGEPLFTSPEVVMTKLASERGLDNLDEASYDSDNFPKVIFACQEEGEHCARCSKPLIESVFGEPIRRE